MPLSKAKDKERWHNRKLQPKAPVLQPNKDWVINPNRYLVAHLKVCPKYNPLQPGDHFNHCPYVNSNKEALS